MRVDHAKLTLPGHRTENQDRLDVVAGGEALLLIVVDGMGGHAHGARAAEVTVTTLKEAFAEVVQPVFDPQGFLTLALARAHDRVVKLGDGVALDHKPRATCAVCLVQDGEAYWAHVGDSRIYQLRGGAIKTRTRDHSHVELLLREGLIAESEMRNHPMRNFVECCLGGESVLPEMTLSRRQPLEDGDVLMVCTDGVWSNLKDTDIAALLKAPGKANGGWRPALEKLVEQAVAASTPHSDNATAASLVWHH